MTTALPLRDLLFFADFAAYGETPLPVQLRGEEVLVFTKAASDVELSLAEPSPPDLSLVDCKSFPEFRLSARSTSQRILQHLQAVAMLVRINEQFIMVSLPGLNNLTVMPSGTTPVLKTCIERLALST